MNPKILIVVCIHDRLENLRRWIHAWEMCEQMGAKLYFVHNISEGMDVKFLENYCLDRGIGYIRRENIGYETGVIQDVILGRILGNEDWDVYFSFTDDTLPMSKGFLKEYIQEIVKPDVGIACMEISGVVTPHVRTTGWCIKRDVANNLHHCFSVILNKEQCYHFEHMGGDMTLMAQVLRMDKRVVQLSNIRESSLWDTDHHAEFNRWEEWHKEFPGYNN